jgi:phosphatidylserine/phosphatidylglycerophosphate/cardiolipin synthase-like enzyme
MNKLTRFAFFLLTVSLPVLLAFSLVRSATLRDLVADPSQATRQGASAVDPAGVFTTPSASSIYLPIVSTASTRLLIAGVYIDSFLSGDPDEAILLWNLGPGAQPLAGWQIAAGTQRAAFPLTTTLQLAAGERLWCTAQATVFRTTFAEEPRCEWAADSDPNIENLEGKVSFVNTGGGIRLYDAQGKLVDTLLYGNESQPVQGWVGLPAQVYTRGVLSAEGQVWQRKLDLASDLPLDSDRASDWAGDLADLRWGRRVRWPAWGGWTRHDFGQPIVATETASVTLLVGPEGLYQPLAEFFNSATQRIDLSIYSFEHPELAQVLSNAAQRGVRVRILLEGRPPGGISNLQKWCVAQLANSGVDVRYLAVRDEAPNGYATRYRYIHAKYGIIDGRLVINGTDNFNYDSMPVSQAAVVGGRRGFYLASDAPTVVTTLQRIFESDWRPDRFLDLVSFAPEHPKYGNPPADFVLSPPPQYFPPDSPFRQPFSLQGAGQWIVMSAPENALRPDAGLLGLIEQAGASDEILWMQLYEHKHWGDTASSPVADPNPRLLGLIEAARRGAKVRLLLDSYFDDNKDLRSNRATLEYVRAVASAEGLDLEVRLGNPTRGGVHAKLALLRLQQRSWSTLGSLNGGEVSHKLNREVVLMTDLPDVYARLSAVFTHDWTISAAER